MTTKTIPAGSDSAVFELGLGNYSLEVSAGKFATINQTFAVTQTDINTGSKLINLGYMTPGTHTFVVTLSGTTDDGFTVKLKRNGAVVETKTTTNRIASFTVTAPDHTDDSIEYVIEVTRNGYATITEDVEATQAEFRLCGEEDVPLTVGKNTVTLTVKVIAQVNAHVEVN